GQLRSADLSVLRQESAITLKSRPTVPNNLSDPATPRWAQRRLIVRAQFLEGTSTAGGARVSVSRAPPTDPLRGRVLGGDRLALVRLGGLAQRHHVGGLVGGPQRVGRHQ